MKIGTIIDDMTIISTQVVEGRPYATVKCGICYRVKEMTIDNLRHHRGTTHRSCGFGLRKKNKRFTQIWKDMRSRTTNQNDKQYTDYGRRGIGSDAFTNFIDFYDTMFLKYMNAVSQCGDESVVSLDRIDVNDDYSPNNCRFITLAMQQTNTRKNRPFIAINHVTGETVEGKTQSAFARAYGLSKQKVNLMLNHGASCNGWTMTFIETDSYC